MKSSAHFSATFSTWNVGIFNSKVCGTQGGGRGKGHEGYGEYGNQWVCVIMGKRKTIYSICTSQYILSIYIYLPTLFIYYLFIHYLFIHYLFIHHLFIHHLFIHNITLHKKWNVESSSSLFPFPYSLLVSSASCWLLESLIWLVIYYLKFLKNKLKKNKKNKKQFSVQQSC